MGSYQKAVTTVLEKMSEEDVEELEKVVELWNKEGGPSDVQLKWVFKSFKFSCFKLMVYSGRLRGDWAKT